MRASGTAATPSGWDAEYARRGIPSSYRTEPSEAVVRTLDEWPRLGPGGAIARRGLDVGCGTGRNTAYAASRGTAMTGFDSSAAAIDAARRRIAGHDLPCELLVHDLEDGLPAGDGEIDLVLDVFVYKHQLSPEARRRHRAELARVLAPGGLVLLSLAQPGDGYYGGCPAWPDPDAGPNAVVDPVTGVGSVLFSLDALAEEVRDVLTLVMAWTKEKPGWMHGRRYTRRTLATVWRSRARPVP
jgi:SAM-dependent methyltransferase